MKHLFIYILCAIMTCGAYAQTNVRTSPPVVKFKTLKSEMAMRSGKFGKKSCGNAARTRPKNGTNG